MSGSGISRAGARARGRAGEARLRSSEAFPPVAVAVVSCRAEGGDGEGRGGAAEERALRMPAGQHGARRVRLVRGTERGVSG